MERKRKRRKDDGGRGGRERKVADERGSRGGEGRKSRSKIRGRNRSRRNRIPSDNLISEGSKIKEEKKKGAREYS